MILGIECGLIWECSRTFSVIWIIWEA